MNIYFLKYKENEQAFIGFLSEQRRLSADSINNAAVKREKIYSYALLRYALYKDFGIKTAPIFSYGERGKPYITDGPYFSLSHACGCTACVADNSETGLDIQDIRPLKADISKKICTENELKNIGASAEPHKEICRLWCIKESVGKLTGMGFAEGFQNIDTVQRIIDDISHITERNNFFISISANKKLKDISIIDVSEDEILYILNKIS